ncbi:hypothetical protein ZIOFF_055344 [Zingiber officinale]|uniref:Uncharacterized protein n=1 Tax=Zingiber officinale TaxID=94328 RepID=A0A8J5FBL2_ZINOF|nr:hypothetical protein ZIOFF_055344 [Zingiber officinale]
MRGGASNDQRHIRAPVDMEQLEMEDAKTIGISSSPPAEIQSQISSLIFETWQQVQDAMESMVKMTNEIEQTSAEIAEEIEKCKEYLVVRSKVLEEEKESLQRAAFAVLQIFNPDAI